MGYRVLYRGASLAGEGAAEAHERLSVAPWAAPRGKSVAVAQCDLISIFVSLRDSTNQNNI